MAARVRPSWDASSARGASVATTPSSPRSADSRPLLNASTSASGSSGGVPRDRRASISVSPEAGLREPRDLDPEAIGVSLERPLLHHANA